ncbi:MAG: hypothetical protein J4N82_01640 [Chloroflexi bacterium]|nr:hypothetical protein [Chloroflexota bacterium]
MIKHELSADRLKGGDKQMATNDQSIVKIRTEGVAMPVKQRRRTQYTPLYEALGEGQIGKPFELVLGEGMKLDNARDNMRVFAEEHFEGFEVTIEKVEETNSVIVLKEKRGKNGTKGK